EDIVNRQTRMGDAYSPAPYPGHISLIRAAETQDDGRAYAEELGWSKYAQGGVRVLTNPGQHMSIFIPPNVDTLAPLVDRILQTTRDRAANVATSSSR
ncbi:MAG: hypothetical protein AAFY15_00895, partial [Cyanobacteria bacterium J06648_11]